MNGGLEDFLRDVASHEMKVLRDDGSYRHLLFKRPDTGAYHFALVTWPGYLAYSGDMGCFVFQRLTDMFEFFRGKPEGPLRINLGYWSEKLEAVDGGRRGGCAKEFSEALFREAIISDMRDWFRRNRDETTKAERRELWEAVKDQVLEVDGDGGGYRMQCAAHDFDHFVNEKLKRFYFEDFGEHDVNAYTQRFVWCCYALAWGIRKYDESKSLAVAA